MLAVNCTDGVHGLVLGAIPQSVPCTLPLCGYTYTTSPYRSIILAFRDYQQSAEWEVARWQANFAQLPPEHRRLLPSQPAKFAAARQAISTNMWFIKSLLQVRPCRHTSNTGAEVKTRTRAFVQLDGMRSRSRQGCLARALLLRAVGDPKAGADQGVAVARVFRHTLQPPPVTFRGHKTVDAAKRGVCSA